MEFRVLGPIELLVAGRPQELGAAKERCLLAALLLARGRPVTVGALIERMWGPEPPAEVQQSLHANVSRLRKSLRAAGVASEARLVATSHTYTLEVDPEAVDLYRFHRLRAQANSISDSGDDWAAAKLLHDAEALWRGEPLTGIAGDWAERTRSGLDSEYRAMALELVDAELKLGRHAHIIGYLHDLTDKYPFDETFTGRLMVALYRCGRQSDAVKLYMATQELLASEAGLDPSPFLRDLYQGILRHDAALGFRPERLGGQARSPNNLPTIAAEFTGRGEEIAALTERAAQGESVISIEGMPGVGKTSLANKIAHDIADQFPDGQIFLHLHAHDPQRSPTPAATALSSLLRALGVPPGRIPPGSAERAKLWRRELAARRVLIVLDDACDSDQVRPLLPGATRCQVVITSRRSLDGLPGSYQFPLRVLPVDEAVALFTRIAETDEPLRSAEVVDAVGLCGCLPLAISLAATRLRDGLVPSVSTLSGQLSEAGTSVEDPHDPVRAAFELSYRDLTATQQRVFRRLGLHPGPEFTAVAAAALAEVSAADAERALADLAGHHLLERVSPGRYSYHDLARRFARSRAVGEEGESVLRRAVGRVLDFYLLTADRADRILYPHRGRPEISVKSSPEASFALTAASDAQAWLEAEWRNLLWAVDHSVHHEWSGRAIELAGAVAQFFDATGRYEEAELIQRRALATARSLESPLAVAGALLNLAVIQWRTGRLRDTFASASEARDIYHATTDQRREAVALDWIGLSVWSTSNFRAALAYFGEARDLYGAVGDTHGVAECLGHLGMALWHVGRYPEALRNLEDSLAVYRTLGDQRSEANTLNNIADIKLHLGYHRDAAALYSKAREIYRSIPNRRINAILLVNVGNVEQYKGEFSKALSHYRSALSEFTQTGDRPNESDVLNNIGTTLCRMSKYEEAVVHHQKALSVAGQIENRYEKVRAILGIGDAIAGAERYSAALEQYRACQRLAREIDDPYLEARALSGLAEATQRSEGRDAARIYWRQAFDLYQRLGVPDANSAWIRLQDLGSADS